MSRKQLPASVKCPRCGTPVPRRQDNGQPTDHYKPNTNKEWCK